MRHPWQRKIWLFCALSLILLGCAGADTRDFSTRSAEFFANYGLELINADAFYAQANTPAGDGITVAVIDSGLDFGHPEFNNKVSFNRSVDITADPADRNARIRLRHFANNDHGTLVSGVIAAAKDGRGVQGVAYDATLMVVKISDREFVGREGRTYFFSEDLNIAKLAEAIDHAVASNAHVINISLGHRSIYRHDGRSSNIITRALMDAAKAGVVVAIAAGNERGGGPTYPAIVAGASAGAIDCGSGTTRNGDLGRIFCANNDLDLRRGNDDPFSGHVIAVSSVDRDGRSSGFSSTCAVADRRFCLAAPGEDIMTTQDRGQDSRGEGYTTVSGTSFAAPHVAGAVAVLLSASPGLSGQDAVKILLETARDPNISQADAQKNSFDITDRRYGNGILDLEAALRPIRGITTQAGQAETTLRSASLSLPVAFGDALGQSGGGGELNKIVAYDSYERAFVVDLSPRVNHQGFDTSLDSILSFESLGEEVGQTSLNLGRFNLTTQFSASQNEEEEASKPSIHFNADLGAANLGVFTGEASRPIVLGFYGETLQGLGITQATPSPYAHLVQNGAGITIDSRLKEWALSYGLREGDGVSGNALAFDVKAEREFDIGGDSRIYIGGLISVIDEQNSFLGASGRGLFDGSSGTTQSFTAGMGYAHGNTRIFGQVSGGRTRIETAGNSGGLLRDFSTIKTSAALVGLSQQKIFTRSDRFDIILSRPLKVYSASARLNADISKNAGVIDSNPSRISLTPSGQQTNLEITYSNALNKTTNLSLGLALIRQPAHRASAKDEHALALRWVRHF